MSWKLGMGCCCATSGPWDWYADYHTISGTDDDPSTPETPFFGRVASIYDPDGSDSFQFADMSYLAADSAYEWSVEMLAGDAGSEGANWLAKFEASSICPLGVTSRELVYYYLQADGEGNAWCLVDAEAKSVEWIVRNDDWPSSEIGSITMGAVSGGGLTTPPVYPELPAIVTDFQGMCCHESGLRRIQALFDQTAAFRSYFITKEWTILNFTGLPSYTEVNAYDEHIADGGTDGDMPMHTYHVLDHDDVYDGSNNRLPLLGDSDSNPFPKPVAHAAQGNKALGFARPYLNSFPDPQPSGGDTPYDYTPDFVVVIGEVVIDPDGHIYVDGGVEATKSGGLGHLHEDDVNVRSIRPGAEWFDASDGAYIAVINWWHNSENGDDPDQDDDTLKTQLICSAGGGSVEITLHVQDGYTDTMTTDNTAYYPLWFGVRVLQKSEGSGTKCVSFERMPFNAAEDAGDEFSGDGRLINVRLRMHGNSAYLVGRFPQGTPASGTGTFSYVGDGGTPMAMDFVAAGGGDADREAWGNGPLTVILHQSSTRNCTYDRTTSPHELHVYLDIAGGDDKIGDVMDVIGRSDSAPGGGDIYVSGVVDETLVIDAGDTGTVTLSGAVNGVTLGAYPIVHDSSDRFFYVTGFYYRLDDEYPRPLYSSWQMSHDLTILNPCGIGARTDRSEPDAISFMVPNSNVSCVKNSELIDFCPETEEI